MTTAEELQRAMRGASVDAHHDVDEAWIELQSLLSVSTALHDSVTESRAHRGQRSRRREVFVAAAVVVALVVLGGIVLLTRSRSGSSPQIESPANSTGSVPTTATTAPPTTIASTSQYGTGLGDPKVSIFAGVPAFDASALAAPLEPVTPVATPHGVTADDFVGYDDHGLWISSSSPSAGSPASSSVMPLDGSIAPLDVPGLVYGYAEHRGVRWVYVREFQDPSAQQYHLLRYTNEASVADVDIPLPLDGQPAGSIAVTDDGVWIPARASILRIDPDTGALAASISVPYQFGHELASYGSQLLVVDANRILTVDPTTNTIAATTEVAPAGAGLGAMVTLDGTIWTVLHRGETSTTLYRLDDTLQVNAQLDLPGYFSIDTDGTRLWLTGALQIGIAKTDGANAEAILLIDQATTTVAHTLVLHGIANDVAWTADDEVLISGRPLNGGNGGAGNQTLYRIEVPTRS